MPRSVTDRLGVCSWSLEPSGPEDLKAKLDDVGLNRVQLDLMPLLEGGAWAGAGAKLADLGIEVVGGMMRTVGEDYTTPATIKATGGVVPDATWPATWANIKKMGAIADELGLRFVMFHAGFMPHEESDPQYAKLVNRLKQIADLFGERGTMVGLETGQESADTLLAFLDALGHPNVCVNFDPANMILYDMDEPIGALRKLVSRVGQCHLKDARRTTVEGEWGQELAVGEGEVDWPAFFGVLDDAGFDGYMAIEREGGDRVGDIRKGKEHVLNLVG